MEQKHTLARFKSRFIEHQGCWLWQSSKFKSGYGLFHLGGKNRRAHRVSYELYKGAIPKGMHVLHRCDNPSCVNPDHLFLGTHTDNMRDMARKGRQVSHPLCGEANPGAKITAEQAAAIRKDSRLQRIIAAEYGIHQVLVSRIKHRKAWAHI